MANDRLRREIAFEAARLLFAQQESLYFWAKRRAAERLGYRNLPLGEFPRNHEVREQLALLARTSGGEAHGNAHQPREEDRFQVYKSLLLPLEAIHLRPQEHPEGDALYHSLQVFELARSEAAYDEELQLAALLHEVGLGIDPLEPIPAALEALEGCLTPRSLWLIEHLPLAGQLREGSLGQRSRRRLEADENFEDLLLLDDCDRRGRQPGRATLDLDSALRSIQTLSQEWE